MQARRIARELALLGMSQLPDKPETLSRQSLESLLLSAVRTLVADAKDTLETAASELRRGNDRLIDSETRSADVLTAQGMVKDAIEITQTAINRLGNALELPEFVQLANQREVKDYALQILTHVVRYLPDIDAQLNEAMVAWQLKRLARIDRDVLRMATTEIVYLGTPDRVAINEAVELAKRYSGEDGHRFINGVMRRVVDQMATGSLSSAEQADSTP